MFIEGRPCDVADAVRDLVTVYRRRILVPPEERSTLLSIRNPLHQDIPEGEWVRCRHGLYRGDVGLVCARDESSEAELIVAFLPRIPDKSTRSAPKRKRPTRPEPRKWCADLAKAVWGEKVRKISGDEFEMNRETYKEGLVLKHLPPASVAVSDPPRDIGPFLGAQFISDLPIYSSVALRFAQDTIKVRHRVKVFDGEQQGLVGNVIDVSDGTAKVDLHTDDETPPLIISVRALTNLYLPGDHVKYRYNDENEHGIVSAVQQDAKTLTFVEKDTHMVVRIIQLTQHTLISLARSSHTWTPWSHGPPPPIFIVSHRGYG